MAPSLALHSATRIALGLAVCSAASLLRAAQAGTLRVDEDGLSIPQRLPSMVLLAVGLLIAVVPYLRLLRGAAPTLAEIDRGVPWIHLAAALALPFSSNDIFSNLAYGHMLQLGKNPYLAGPLALGSGDPFVALVGQRWQREPLVYGPLLGLLNGAVVLLGRPLFAMIGFKLLMLAVCLVGLRLCRSAAQAALGEDTLAARAAFCTVAWNPLLAWDVSGQAHNDGVLFLFLAAALAALYRGLVVRGALALAAAFFSKFAVAPLLGLWLLVTARRSPLRAGLLLLLVLAVGALCYAPLYAGIATLRGPLTAGGVAPERLNGSFLQLVYDLTELFSKDLAATLLRGAAALIGLGLLLLALRLVARAVDLRSAVRGALVFTLAYNLLGAAWWQPWYLLWLLPLCAVEPDDDLRRLCALYTVLGLSHYVLDSSYLPFPQIHLPILVLAQRLSSRRRGLGSALGPAGLARAADSAGSPPALR